MAAFSRPDSDLQNTGELWSVTPLWSKIDEVTPDDGDLITTSGFDGEFGLCELGLTDVTEPDSDSGHTIRVRAKKTEVGGTSAAFRIRLLQGVTLIKSFTPSVTTSFSTFSLTLTEAEASNITDYTDLRFDYRGLFTGGFGESSVEVSWSELEVPSTITKTYTIDTFLQIEKSITYTLDTDILKAIFLRPDEDVTIDGWTTTPLFSKIDEEAPDDSDNIGSSQTVDLGCEIGLSPSGDPQSNVQHIMSVRARHTLIGGGSANLRMQLMDGSTIITTQSFTLVNDFRSFAYTLTSTEADAITDYENLRFKFIGFYSGAGDHFIDVSWAEFYFPVGALIDTYSMDIFLQSTDITKNYTLDVIIGIGAPEIQPSEPEAPPEMMSLQITGVDEDGVETVEVFSATDFNPFGSTFGDDTKVINYGLSLEANKGRRLKVTIDDPKGNLDEVSTGYLVDIVLDNIDLGFRGYKFEFVNAAGDFTDSNGSSDVLTPGTGATILDASNEFGKWSKCVRLDGTMNGRLDGPDNSDFDMTNTVLLAGWIRPKATITGTQRIVYKLTGVPINGYNLSVEPTNQITFEIFNSGSADSLTSSANVIDINAWNYIIAYWDGTDMKMWIFDESLQQTEKLSTLATVGNIGSSSGIAIQLGHNGGTESFNGDLDEFILAPLGTNTLPTNIETLVERKMLKAFKCPVRYMKRGVVTSVSIKNSQLTLQAEDKDVPTDYPLYDIMYEGQFTASDEVAFGFERAIDISNVVSDTNVDIKFQKADGTDLAATDIVVRPIDFRIPKNRFLDVQSASPSNLWDVSSGDFSYFFTQTDLSDTDERVELGELRIGLCLDFNGVSGDYKVTIGQFDNVSPFAINAKTPLTFTSDGSTGFKWVYHTFDSLDAFQRKPVEEFYIMGVEPVRSGTTWSSTTPLKWAHLHTTDEDTKVFGVIENQSGISKQTPGGQGQYWWREDKISETMDILDEGSDYDLLNDNFIRIVNSDEFQVPDSLILSPIPSLILPTGSKGGFGRATYFYSTISKFSSDYIKRIFDKIEVTTPEFQGRVTSEVIALYSARGGKALDHLKNIMRLSDSELVFFGGTTSMIRDKVRSGFIKNHSFETAGQAASDARHWKKRNFGLGSSSFRTTIDFNTGTVSWRLRHQNSDTHFAEMYQDLSDVYVGQHFQLWRKRAPGDEDPDNLLVRFYSYGSFENAQDIDIKPGLTTDWTKTTFTLTQTLLDSLGEKNRVRIGVRSQGQPAGSGNFAVTFIDDFSPVFLYGFKDKGATVIGNVPIQIEGPHIIPEPAFEESIRKGKKTIAILKAGASSTGFSTGKPHLAIALDKPSVNFYGYRGDIREGKQRGDIKEFYEEALSRLNVERQRTLNLKLAGQWAFLSGENVAILYPDIGLKEYLPFPINSITIGPEDTKLRSRIRLSELAKPIKDKAELLDAISENVFEAPVRDKFAQLIFGFATIPFADYTKIELRKSGATDYREQTTDITEMTDGSIVAYWKPEKETLLTGATTDTPYIEDIHLVNASDVTQESFTLIAGLTFRRIRNQWVILWLFLSDG